jgi:hypothetical protein
LSIFFASPVIMVSARRNTKPPQITQGGVSSGGSGGDYGLEKEGSGSVIARRTKSRASGKASSKQKGKQPEGRRNTGKLSKLPDMPLDVLYEVGYGINSATDDGVDDDAFGVRRYSLLSTR